MRARYTGRLTSIAAMMALLSLVSHAQQGQTLQVGGVTRIYTVRAPPHLPEGARVPLVFVFHGGGGTTGNAERMAPVNI